MKLEYPPQPTEAPPPPELERTGQSVRPVRPVRDVSGVNENKGNVRHNKDNPSISDMVEMFLESGNGRFTTNDVNTAACAYSPKDKNAVYQKLYRLKNANRIRQIEGRYGTWEPVVDDFEEVDFDQEDATPVKLPLPLGLSDMVEIHRGDQILIQGETNTGKTALMMSIMDEILTAAYNPISLKRYKGTLEICPKDKPYRYLFTEGKKEFKKRMVSFNTRPISEWTRYCSFIDRRNLWHQLTLPDGITFVDYLEVDEDFFEAGKFLNQIHAALNDGIAIVAVQKNPDKEWGVGGAQIMAKPRLVINLIDKGGDKSRLLLKKVKHNKDYKVKAQGLYMDFEVTPDCRLQALDTHWRRIKSKPSFQKK